MSGLLEYVLWFLGAPLELGVLVCAYKRGGLRTYLFLNLYMGASFAVSVSRFKILHSFGLNSAEYAYFYYYSDALLTVFLYLALASLYVRVFSELKAERYVKFGAVLLLIGTAYFSFAVVQQSTSKLLTHFVVEMSQNLYFVGVVLTYLLWGAILKLRETRTRLVQLVLALGVYFSLFTANYALRNLYPSMGNIFQAFPPLIGCFLPLAWCYAFWRVPEEARLAPSRLAVIPR